MAPALCTTTRLHGDKEVSEASDFAARLRELREKAGLSQYALAKLAGISKQAIHQLEEGTNKPSWETVQKLALALGATCEAFVDPGLSVPDVEPAKRGRPRKAGPSGEKPKGKGKRGRT